MRKRSGVAVAVAGMLVAGAASSCGGDDEEALSKSEYIKRGDAICARGDREIEKAAGRLGPGQPNPKEIADFGKNTAIPNIESQLSKLRDLPAPEGDEDTVKRIYDAADDAVEKAKADPEVFVRGQPFREATRMAQEYGFKACGS